MLWSLRTVFGLLEPFAVSMWRRLMRSLSSTPDRFQWHDRRLFGGLCQIVLAERRVPFAETSEK
jgi:hypothetical protein